MLKLIGCANGDNLVQFTGRDLKEWYSELGENKVYICHVVMKKVSELIGKKWISVNINSQDMIDALRLAVPHRFLINPPASSTVHMHMLRKYVSKASFGLTNTRKNLIRCIPDEFVFTFEVK